MGSARKKLRTLKKLAFDSNLHPREGAGSPDGGQFVSKKIPIKFNTDNFTLKGRQTTTLQELAAIGADEDTRELSDTQRFNLTQVRNGHNSYEDFLAAPPSPTNRAVVFASDRVFMMVTNKGDVLFNVDNSYSSKKGKKNTLPKPSRELIEMQMAFEDYLEAPAGQRVLTNTPVRESGEKYKMRVAHYKKAGFINLKESPVLKAARIKTSLMALDNRKDKTTEAELMNDGINIVTIKGQELNVKQNNE